MGKCEIEPNQMKRIETQVGFCPQKVLLDHLPPTRKTIPRNVRLSSYNSNIQCSLPISEN